MLCYYYCGKRWASFLHVKSTNFKKHKPLQPPRLISMQTMQRGNMNCGAFQAHQMRMAQNAARIPGIPRHNGPQYSMMQPHLQRQVYPVYTLHLCHCARLSFQ